MGGCYRVLGLQRVAGRRRGCHGHRHVGHAVLAQPRGARHPRARPAAAARWHPFVLAGTCRIIIVICIHFSHMIGSCNITTTRIYYLCADNSLYHIGITQLYFQAISIIIIHFILVYNYKQRHSTYGNLLQSCTTGNRWYWVKHSTKLSKQILYLRSLSSSHSGVIATKIWIPFCGKMSTIYDGRTNILRTQLDWHCQWKKADWWINIVIVQIVPSLETKYAI